jgi:hypothetical protein
MFPLLFVPSLMYVKVSLSMGRMKEDSSAIDTMRQIYQLVVFL